MTKIFCSSEEACKILHDVSEDRLKELVAQGVLREFRDGKLIKYRLEEVKSLSEQKVLVASSTGWHEKGDVVMTFDDLEFQEFQDLQLSSRRTSRILIVCITLVILVGIMAILL